MAKKKKEEPIVEVVEEVRDIPDSYILHIGETLEDVSKKFGVSVEKLNELNNYPTNVIGSNQIKLK